MLSFLKVCAGRVFIFLPDPAPGLPDGVCLAQARTDFLFSRPLSRSARCLSVTNNTITLSQDEIKQGLLTPLWRGGIKGSRGEAAEPEALSDPGAPTALSLPVPGLSHCCLVDWRVLASRELRLSCDRALHRPRAYLSPPEGFLPRLEFARELVGMDYARLILSLLFVIHQGARHAGKPNLDPSPSPLAMPARWHPPLRKSRASVPSARRLQSVTSRATLEVCSPR